MKTSHTALLPVHCSFHTRSFVPHTFSRFKMSLPPVFKPIKVAIPQVPMQIDVFKTIASTKERLLDAIVDSVFVFIDHPMLPSQSNFAPVEELQNAVPITSNEGQIPNDFPEGVYVRNGSNPLFGGLKSTKSFLGRTSQSWVEGEGMLHALYFKKESEGSWTVTYNNKHVETDTYKLEKQRNKPLFLPAIIGDSPAILSAYLLNWLRFGEVNKHLSNTNVFEHSGKIYSVAENYIPQEIDIFTLNTIKNWNLNGVWNRPFNSHPKKAPGTGELVIFGVGPTKPFLQIGIVSADGKKLVHKADLNLKRGCLCHDIGVTERYNVIMDFPLILDIHRLLRGGPLLKYNKEEYARIGVMPRYGDADSIKWFEVEPNSTFHIINSFEDGDEVVLWGCRALDSIIPGPDDGLKEFKWFSRCYEWRLNMQTGVVKEKYLSVAQQFMDFPVINADFIGIRNKYAYTQVVDPIASCAAGQPKYGGLAKLYFAEKYTNLSLVEKQPEDLLKVEYHMFEKNVFCSGSAFVPKEGGTEEDDGWIITFVHNENTTISQVYIIDTQNFSGEPVAKIKMPCRVPYGFHGAFMSISL